MFTDRERDGDVMQITLNVSEELGQRLRPYERKIGRILELGLREVSLMESGGFNGTAEVLEFLASLPKPKEVLALRPSVAWQARLDDLLVKSNDSGLSESEEAEWEQYEYLEHLVRMAKIRAKAELGEGL